MHVNPSVSNTIEFNVMHVTAIANYHCPIDDIVNMYVLHVAMGKSQIDLLQWEFVYMDSDTPNHSD